MPNPQNRHASTLARWGAVFLLGFTGWLLRDYWTGLAWAGILAVIFWPLSQRFMGRWRFLGPGISSLLAASLVLVPLAFVLVQIAQGLSILVPWFRTEAARSWPFPSTLTHFLPRVLLGPAHHGWSILRHTLLRFSLPASAGSAWWSSGSALLRHSATLFSLLGGAEASLLNAGIAFLVLYFLLQQGDRLQHAVGGRVRRYFGETTWQILSLGVRILRGTFISLVITALFEGMSFWAVYALAGVPHPILWATISGLLSVVPFGASLAFSLICLWLWLGQDAWLVALVVFAAGYAITAFADNILKPLLIGGASRMPFALIFLGLLGGLSTLGILGVFVGPMVFGMVQAWWQVLLPAKQQTT